MRKRRINKIAENVLYAAIAVALVLGVWAVAATAAGSELVLPSVPAAFDALFKLLGSGAFWKAIGGTLLRAAISYAIAAALFFLLFFICSCSKAAAHIVEPLISALRTLPTMAVALLLAIWSNGYVAPVILGASVVMPQLYSAARTRNAQVPSDLEDVLKVYGAGRVRSFTSLYLPHAATGFAESFSAALSFDIKIVIAAEILVQTAGSLGMMMKLSQINFEAAALIAMILCAVVISVALEYAVRAILKRALSKYYG